ncbi:hypothetical protein V2J09_009315 [Rumex salicifolius]
MELLEYGNHPSFWYLVSSVGCVKWRRLNKTLITGYIHSPTNKKLNLAMIGGEIQVEESDRPSFGAASQFEEQSKSLMREFRYLGCQVFACIVKFLLFSIPFN